MAGHIARRNASGLLTLDTGGPGPYSLHTVLLALVVASDSVTADLVV